MVALTISIIFMCSQDDYRRAVKEYDEKVFVGFKVMLRELRNIYVSLHCVYLLPTLQIPISAAYNFCTGRILDKFLVS